MMADQHIVDHAHAREDAQELEGACHAAPRDFVRRQAGDFLVVEHDLGACIRQVHA
jgi:hypothetical protein